MQTTVNDRVKVTKLMVSGREMNPFQALNIAWLREGHPSTSTDLSRRSRMKEMRTNITYLLIISGDDH